MLTKAYIYIFFFMCRVRNITARRHYTRTKFVSNTGSPVPSHDLWNKGRWGPWATTNSPLQATWHYNVRCMTPEMLCEVHMVIPWWRHQMETFSALLAICAGNSPVPGEFPTQRPVTRSFDVFFDLRLNKWLSKQSWGWWFETPPCSLWRHCNAVIPFWDIGGM